ncbi:MAG TPA: C13 family peptidase, partial [Thermoanaerobaculia bacterium]|nr:C13 family peptidase [Thermoanaerobaculia bacterium]
MSRLAAALLAALLLLALAAPAAATDWGIFVDGSYSDTRDDTEMDRLIDRRLAEADRIMGGRHPGSERTTVDEKAELRDALARIQCRCGDTITVVLMGHGTEDRFVFSKAPRAERRLEASDLAAWLEGAAKECCCKIRVVIFSCHSGSFLDELLAQPHVDSVWASSAADERSYSEAAYELDGTFRDGGDWMQGFLEDWRDAPRGD